MRIKPLREFNRIIQPPPDKSIMQRAVILGYLCGGVTIENPSFCGDCISAIECVKALGGDIFMDGASLVIRPSGTLPTHAVLDAGNSATTARLMLSAAAGLKTEAKIIGDSSLISRNMTAVVRAVQAFGAKISTNSGRLPIICQPADLFPADFVVSPPSAQVKSAAIIAALFASAENGGKSHIYEVIKTRDHTERMLNSFGIAVESADILDGAEQIDGQKVCSKISVFNALYCENGDFSSREKGLENGLEKGSEKDCSHNNRVRVAGDFSSAAFAIALAAVTKNGRVAIKNCGLNPTRLGMLEVLKSAGLDISAEQTGESGGEPLGNIFASGGEFSGFNIDESILPTLIDEVPALAVCACFASGKSVFSGLSALRNKESNRILGIFEGLKQAGASIKMQGDTLEFLGGGLDKTKKIEINSTDHRIVMALSVAAAASGGGFVLHPESAEVSYPSFFDDIIF